MSTEQQVDHAVDFARAAAVDAAHGGEGRTDSEAETYADTLCRLHQAHVFDGMIAMYTAPYDKCLELQVTSEYFEEHFGCRADIERDPWPDHECICKSVTHEGVKIFCVESTSRRIRGSACSVTG
jgi:hypothetical protein